MLFGIYYTGLKIINLKQQMEIYLRKSQLNSEYAQINHPYLLGVSLNGMPRANTSLNLIPNFLWALKHHT